MQVGLSLVDVEDDDALRSEGLAGMRRRRLVRLCRQAQQQGALLTVQDLAYLTCSSLSTVKRDLAECRGRGQSVPTRGNAGVSERRLSRPARVAQLFLNGATRADISRQVGEPKAGVERMLDDFVAAAVLFDRGRKSSRIATLTGAPPTLVAEYSTLCDAARNDDAASRRLHELMTVPRRQNHRRP